MDAHQQGRVLSLHQVGYSANKIEKIVGVSRKAIKNYLCDPIKYNKKKVRGICKKVTEREERMLVRMACTGKNSAKQLKDVTNVSITPRQISNVLNNSGILSFSKCLKSQLLTKKHMDERKMWASEKIHWGMDEWRKCVFSDEKKFNLDGPDGWDKYWHDKRKPKAVKMKRQSGGGSVMVWGAFSVFGLSQLAVLDESINSGVYVDTLSEFLLPFIDLHYGRECIFQQDNAPAHSSLVTKEFFREQNIDVMNWPARSPDLNPIENLWSILSRSVYENRRQFGSKKELKLQILESWSKIDQNIIDSLINSMVKRCHAVIE